MNWEQEQKLKAMAAEANCAEQTTSGSLGGAYAGCPVDQDPARASLRERVTMDLKRAQREARKKVLLEELNYLLGKNPDVARILDLLEEVRG